MLIWLVQILLGGFSAVLWANFKEAKATAISTAAELAAYKILIAEKYSTKTELKDALNQVTFAFEKYSEKLDTRLERIEGKIDLKMDKP